MTLYNGDGAAWTLGVQGATRYPTDDQGAATATASSSSLLAARAVQILGYTVTATPGAGGVVSFVNDAGSVIAGLAFPAEAVGTYAIGANGDGIHYSTIVTASTGSNLGIKCSANVTAIMHWRKLA